MNLRSTLLALFALAVAAPAIVLGTPAIAAEPARLKLDYAYYNPVSLVLKDKHWLEDEFAANGTGVDWVLSLGSNKALEYLSGASIDIGSTPRSAPLLPPANRNPIHAAYIYSRPQWPG